MTSLLDRVEAHLVAHLGPHSGRAALSFLGTEQVEVLRFGPDAEGLVRYATLGMSRHAMVDPAAGVTAAHGPRAELVLSLRGAHDSVLRRLAVLGASPAVEGVVVDAGAGLDLGEALWDRGRFTAVLVAEPGGLVPDLPLPDDEPVRVFPLLPMTPNEAAWKRVHGATALEERWLAQGTDLRDPDRREADLS
jgi:hypothetical protein